MVFRQIENKKTKLENQIQRKINLKQWKLEVLKLREYFPRIILHRNHLHD